LVEFISSANTTKSFTQKLNISVCILTKNDQEMIEDCINSVKDFAKEIIVLDYGSTDNTLNIVRSNLNRVYWVKWQKDYSEARNVFFKYATADWILYLDGHEKISEESKKFLTPQLLNKKNVGYIFNVIDYTHNKEVNTFSCRLFKRHNDIKFRLALNESVNTDLQRLSKRNRWPIVPTDILIERYSYKKYFDEIQYHEERLEIARNALEKGVGKLDYTTRLFYKLCEGLSLGCISDYAEGEEVILEVIEMIRSADKQTVYNIPSFIQAFLFLAFKYSKEENYTEGLKILKEGLEIYHDSLMLLIRYVEFLYVLGMYKECLNTIKQIRTMREEDTYYVLDTLDFELIDKLSIKLGRLATEKLETSKK
jgi:glycosyltransferase involved in cell wall biosynthesis